MLLLILLLLLLQLMGIRSDYIAMSNCPAGCTAESVMGVSLTADLTPAHISAWLRGPRPDKSQLLYGVLEPTRLPMKARLTVCMRYRHCLLPLAPALLTVAPPIDRRQPCMPTYTLCLHLYFGIDRGLNAPSCWRKQDSPSSRNQKL